MHDLGHAAREMTRLVNAVRDDQLGDPTPCTGYTLGDLLQHGRELAEAFTVAGRKEQADGASQPPPQGDGTLLSPDWRAEITEWLGRLVGTWSDPANWEGNAWIAGLEAPASAVGTTAANELVVHGWRGPSQRPADLPRRCRARAVPPVTVSRIHRGEARRTRSLRGVRARPRPRTARPSGSCPTASR